jgi:histidinol-phosphate aminotransferase
MPVASSFKAATTVKEPAMRKLLLDRNENQYGPSPDCYEILYRANLEELSLYSRDFTRGVKGELSERLSTSLGIPENRILLSYGSEDMLKQVIHCYVQRGETLLLPRQSWWYYKAIVRETGGQKVEYMLQERKGEFVYDGGEIMRLYDEHSPRVILLASPNNPTGNSIDPKKLAEVVAHCYSSVIVLDEAYYGFSGNSHDHLKDTLDTNSRLVVLRTFSKYYALAGLRIGYACVGEELSHLIIYSARYLGYNRLSEKIACAALGDEKYYRSIAQRMREDKAMYYHELASLEGFSPFLSDANFLLVRYPLRLTHVLHEGLQRRNIEIKFLDDPGLEDCMRITIGTREQNTLVLSVLHEIVRGHVRATTHAEPVKP